MQFHRPTQLDRMLQVHRTPRWRSMGCATILAVLALHAAEPAAAEPAVAEPTWLSWRPPPECPTGAYIRERIEEWLGAPVPTAMDLRVATHLTYSHEQWEISVDVTHNDQVGSRRVAVASCHEAAEFVAVAVVLAIDPTRIETAQLARTDAEDEPPASNEPVEPAVESEEPPTQAPDVLRAEKPSRATRRSVRPFVGVAALGAFGVLPTMRPGGALLGGAQVKNWNIELEAAWLPPAANAVENARAPIAFSLLSGRADLSYLWSGSIGGIGPTLAFQGGLLRARQLTADASAKFEPWLSLGLGGTGLLHAGPWADIVGDAELQIPFTRPKFVLDDGSEVYRVGWGGRIAVGARFFFSPR